MKRTDMICELGSADDIGLSDAVHSSEIGGTEYTDITIDENKSRNYGIRKGRYITISAAGGDTERCVAELLSGMVPEGAVLVAALGNENISPDSLGTKALSVIPATAHLSVHKDFHDLGLRKVYVIHSCVTGKTGIESSSHISCLAAHVGAKCIIAIDSLACSDIKRLCTTIQITDAGIAPGSGVGNERQGLDFSVAGIPVIAVGVPTVIDLDNITDDEKYRGFMVTTRSIDSDTARLAKIIGRAVNRALNPGLSDDEADALILK